jgi:hypothetical protein
MSAPEAPTGLSKVTFLSADLARKAVETTIGPMNERRQISLALGNLFVSMDNAAANLGVPHDLRIEAYARALACVIEVHSTSPAEARHQTKRSAKLTAEALQILQQTPRHAHAPGSSETPEEGAL